MKLNRTRLLLLVLLTAIAAGCQRRADAPLKRDGPPAEIVGQFTNLLVTGSVPDRLGAVRALGTLALESWDENSKVTALAALLRATQFADTNVQNEAWSILFYQSDSEFAPTWSSAAIARAATPELTNVEARIRCGAAYLLLRQDGASQAAASVLFSLLKHPESAVRLQARRALALASAWNDQLKEQLLAQLSILASATDQDIRLDALSQYWEMAGNQSKFSGVRLEVENALLELLRSTNIQVRRKAVNTLLLNEGIATARLASLPLQDFIENGLVNPDPCMAVTMAHVINAKQRWATARPPPVPGTLEALKRGLSDSDPAVRLAALSPMSASDWWRISKEVEKGSTRTSPHPLILQPLTNALHDPDLNVRQSAAGALRYLSDWSEPPLSLSMLWQVKIEALESQNLTARRRAFMHAASLPDPPQKFVKLFHAALKDSDWQVRSSAFEFVGYSGLFGFRVDPRVCRPLCDDPVPGVRAKAGDVLAREAAGQGRGTNAPWAALPTEALRLVNDPFPDVSLAGLIVLRQIAAATNETPVVLEARNRLHQIAVGANPRLKVRLAGCYARTFSWARSPDTEKDLQILAAAPESIVRRHAVAALRILGLSLPRGIQDDPEPEVRTAVTKTLQRDSLAAALASDSLEVLLQKLKAGDPAIRRKAAMGLTHEAAARQKSGGSAEAIRVLLETYTNAPPREFESINHALRSLVAGPDYASLWRQVHAFAVRAILTDEPGAKRGVWPLLVTFTRINPSYEPDQILALAGAGLRRTQDPDVLVRASVMQVLSKLEPILIGRVGDTNAIVARQIRTALVEALSDREPEVAISAAAPFLEAPLDGPNRVARVLSDAELSGRAASILQGRLADPQPDVRQIMASALALIGEKRLETNWVEKALTSWEVLFTRPGRLKEFLYNSSTDISQINLPSGETSLRAIAFGSANPAVRHRAIRTLARLLDAMSQTYDSPSLLSQVLAMPARNGQPTADELNPLREALARIAGSTNIALANEAAKCLSRIRPPDDSLPSDLVRRSHSPNAAERRLAMLELVDPAQTSSERFRKEASRLAGELTKDSDNSVRMAALEAFASNVFPKYGTKPTETLTIEPLVKALDDGNPEVGGKAFDVVCANLWVVPATNRAELASPLINRMMSVTSADRLYRIKDFAVLASFVLDQRVQQRFLLDAQERIDKADNDQSRSQWLSAIGKLYLGFNRPDRAASAFRKAIRLDPNLRDDSVFHDLEKALISAGRYNEVALEPAPRPDGLEILSRLKAIAREQDVARLVQTANRALEGYLPAYGGRTRIAGWGEPDQVIREAVRLLFSLEKLDALEEFLKGALKRYPESPEVAVARAKLCVTQDRKEEAKALLEQELKQHAWNYVALELLGTLCQDTRQPERYEALLRVLVEKHPDQQSLCRPMVELYVRTERTNEARNVIAAFSAAVEVVMRNSGIPDFNTNPEYSWRYSGHQWALSQLMELSGDLDGAIAAQIEANRATIKGRSLLPGQQRLKELYKRAGKLEPAATVK